MTRLRRQGERYFTDGLRDISSDRRLAILAVCTVEWRADIADAIVENHDRIVGKIWPDTKKQCDAQINGAKTSLQDTLRSFKRLGAALLEAKDDDAPLDPAVATACGWHKLEGLVATAAQLGDTMSAEPLTHVGQGYHRFRRYALRMLRALDIKAATVAEPLMAAASIIRKNKDVAEKPRTFLQRNSKWHHHLNVQESDGHRLWEVAVMSHLRDAFRSGDIWLSHSRRYGDLKQALVPIETGKATPCLTVLFDPE
ncbi:Tn3 family transposase ISRsp12 [Roseobacter fucihabitans]|uniref:Tn3 family transposase ISRsp12 n=1 Tax=Roseobacter fucihabitans TaxID=1537242 RepID=A0ABZ2BLC5_9RHOB|nr:hypothetical protein [Roseobacter litoralis]